MYISLEGESIYYDIQGELTNDTTLIFLHPATVGHKTLLPFIKLFEGKRCLFVDMPAHGKSQGKNRTSIEAWGEWYQGFLEYAQDNNLLTKRNILIGYSLGAVIALEVAMRSLDFIHGVVSISGGSDSKNNNSVGQYMQLHPKETFTYLDVTNATRPDNPLTAIPSKQRNIFENMMPVNTCYEDLYTIVEYTALERVKNIKVPVLFFVGDKDTVIDTQSTYNTYQTMPCYLARLIVIRNQKHSLVYTVPERLKKHIDEWIREVFHV